MNIIPQSRSTDLKSHLLLYANLSLLILAFLNIIILPWPNMGKVSVPLRLSFGLIGLLCLALDKNFRQACFSSLTTPTPPTNATSATNATNATRRTTQTWLSQPLFWFGLFIFLGLISLIVNNFPAQGFRQLGLAASIFIGYAAYSYYYPKAYSYPWLAAALSLVLLSSFWLLWGQAEAQASRASLDEGKWWFQTAWVNARFAGYPKQHPATFGWMCAMLSIVSLNAYFRTKPTTSKTSPVIQINKVVQLAETVQENQTVQANQANQINKTVQTKQVEQRSQSNQIFKPIKIPQAHWFWLSLCAFTLFYLLISWSRMYIILGFGLCGLRLCLGLMPKFSWRKLCLYAAALICGCAILAGLYLLAAEFKLVDLRADLTASNTWQSRQYIWQSAWQAFLEQPWLGHGMNSTRLYFANYLQNLPQDLIHSSQFLESSTTHAHNFVLHFLAEGGILGFIAISGLIITCLWQSRHTDLVWLILMILGTSILDLFMGAREHSTLSFSILAVAAMLNKHKLMLKNNSSQNKGIYASH